MKIKQYDIWLVNLNLANGTDPGKTRPVVVIQTELLNESHESTIVCPITTNVNKEIELLRVHLRAAQLNIISDILVDQIRAIDNKRFIKKLGQLTATQKNILKSNLRIVLDI
jgi:mRNA interferase MazF